MTQTPPTPPEKHATSKPSLYLNWEDWLPFFDNPDVLLADKQSQIEALWTIVMCFVDADFKVLGPEDLASPETGGKLLDLTAAMQAAVLNSKDHKHQVEASKEEV